MMSECYYRDTVVEVDLDAIKHNIGEFRRHLSSDVKIMAVVKADAYGHGAVSVAKAALSSGVDWLGVAFLDEALELRAAGIKAPILVMGYIPPRGIPVGIEKEISLTISSLEAAEMIVQQVQKKGKKAQVHLKIDTGMGRLGLALEEVIPAIERLKQIQGLHLQGLFTHFATADERDKTHTRTQYRRFSKIITQLREKGITFPIIHTSNSAAAIDLPEYAHNMVRIGIGMYGYYPSADVNHQVVNLQPALSLKTRIVHLKRPSAGEGVSYGRTYLSDGTRWIATLPIGYADGYSRLLSGKGEVLVKGRRVPVVGRICMDQLMIDVTEVMPVSPDEEVVVYGRQGTEAIFASEIANLLSTIPYEITCMISRRVPRIYLENGRVIAKMNRLG